MYCVAVSLFVLISLSKGHFTPFEKEGLHYHNYFRKIHNTPQMTLNKAMCEEAAAYAAKLASQRRLWHSSSVERNRNGENKSKRCLPAGWTERSAKEAVTSWYKEVCSRGYNFGSNYGQSGTNHFTQVVWKASTQLGIGKAEVEEKRYKCTYIVAHYSPAGNLMGTYAQNVLKGSFQPSVCNNLH